MNAIETRKLAQELGIKNVAKFKKAELDEMIAAIEAERAAAAKKAAKPTKVQKMLSGKICSICEVRPVGTGPGDDDRAYAKEYGYCNTCMTLAGWENAHSDYAHDDIEPQSDDETDTSGRKFSDCWVCHPELDATREAYVPRAGVSRKGQKLTVTLKATGEQKANEVAEQIGAEFRITINSKAGVITLKVQDLVIRWDAQGHFLYGQSFLGTKKVRNAAEAIRLAKPGQA